ncbi:MAG: DUF4350 domain-containing protein [Crocosphaera sp.]
MINSRRRLWLFIGLFIGVLILLTLLVAPTRNQSMSGSTFAVSPDGYAAWYKFMENRKTSIERWKKPFEALVNDNAETPMTLLRIFGQSPYSLVNTRQSEWVKKGNILVILSFQGSVTEAPFTTTHETEFGEVKIETTHRYIGDNKAILRDEFGPIIWEQKLSKGKIIYVNTPYLAANAYRDSPGNYELLAHLVESNPGNKILVDEYIHGYKDQEVMTQTEENQSVFLYLLNTSLLMILIQGLLIVLIVFLAYNNPLDKRKKIEQKKANNSQEYINALATLLQNAKSHDFILKTIGQAEQLQLQKQLGLKLDRPNLDSLVAAWSQQTQKSPMILERLLKQSTQQSSLTDSKLLEWMKQWQTIQQAINPQSSNHDSK